jgi:enoyl-CoA hydratase/carnithine racemase
MRHVSVQPSDNIAIVRVDRAPANALNPELEAPDAVVARALEIAAELGDLPTDAYATVKQQLRGDTHAAMQRVVDAGTDPLAQGWLSAQTGSAAAAALGGAG